jgi:hypothetical protein
MLNLRLSFFASTDVLRKFNEFARQFSLVAADRKVTDQERTELLDSLGELSATIRRDLASEEDLRTERKLISEADLKNLVMNNVNSLFGKTTPNRLLNNDAAPSGRDRHARRTQEARIAALFVRLRTCYRVGQRALAAVASLFGSVQRTPSMPAAPKRGTTSAGSSPG